ncbi:hypothetical protein [Deinococcus kurensis]|uniref:hypothetical protein n=1 Tax=Deinococcus kurensis TaxID=2662757 RepID=UPI0012D2E9BC|nr:hypothetical protein [Deinococcus kurensis]
MTVLDLYRRLLSREPNWPNPLRDYAHLHVTFATLWPDDGAIRVYRKHTAGPAETLTVPVSDAIQVLLAARIPFNHP